jgi:hypothetical protein
MAGYHLISVNQVPGTPANKPLFVYVYTVDVHNGGNLSGRVTATAEERGNSFTLQDPDATFGIVMPGETKTSTDTINLHAKKHFDRSLDARSTSCCVKTERKEKAYQTSGTGELEGSEEGAIPGLGYSALDLEIGVFAKLKAAGAVILISYKKDLCKIEEGVTILGSASVALTGEIIAKVLGEGVPYSIEFAGGVSGGRTWTYERPTTSYLSATIFGKGEVVFDTRKYQFVNLSRTWTDQSTFSAAEAGADIESAIGAAQ